MEKEKEMESYICIVNTVSTYHICIYVYIYIYIKQHFQDDEVAKVTKTNGTRSILEQY